MQSKGKKGGPDDAVDTGITRADRQQCWESGTNPTCGTDSYHSNPPLEAAASTAAVQQVQSPIEFDVPVFEGEIAGRSLTWSQRFVYQARACGFEAELTASKGKGLIVGADVFDGSNVDPARL